MTTIVLVRHGQTEWNRVERFRGRADVPLNDTGMAQAAATGRRVAAGWAPQAVFSSPLSRAMRTAEAIAGHFDLAVQAHPGLLDIDYGEWRGLTPEEARQGWPDELHAWYAAPQTCRIPGGETLADLRARTVETMESVIASYPPQATIVLVAHTVVNRILLLAALGLGNERFWRLKQEPCAINVLLAEAGDYTLVSLNDTCHLAELESRG